MNYVLCIKEIRVFIKKNDCNTVILYLPYIFPSSDKIIFRRPHGGYMARASWKLCSISGLQTPSASADDRSFSSSLISPTSKCLLSAPFVSADPNGPAETELTGVHGDVMVPVPKPLAVNRKKKKTIKRCYIIEA